MYQERWTAEKGAGGEYHFTVKKAAPPIGGIIWGLIFIPFFGIGLIVLAIHIIPRMTPSRFTVGHDGFVVGGQTIPMSRVNGYGLSNPGSNTIYNSASLTGQVFGSLTSKAWRLTVQAGASRVNLATALTLEQGQGLLADVERAMDGTL